MRRGLRGGELLLLAMELELARSELLSRSGGRGRVRVGVGVRVWVRVRVGVKVRVRLVVLEQQAHRCEARRLGRALHRRLLRLPPARRALGRLVRVGVG